MEEKMHQMLKMTNAMQMLTLNILPHVQVSLGKKLDKLDAEIKPKKSMLKTSCKEYYE